MTYTLSTTVSRPYAETVDAARTVAEDAKQRLTAALRALDGLGDPAGPDEKS